MVDPNAPGNTQEADAMEELKRAISMSVRKALANNRSVAIDIADSVIEALAKNATEADSPIYFKNLQKMTILSHDLMEAHKRGGSEGGSGDATGGQEGTRGGSEWKRVTH